MKKIIKLILVFMSIITLCGCHGQKESREFIVPDSFDLSKNYEISFWAKNDTNINQAQHVPERF